MAVRAILRTAKLKGVGKTRASEAHLRRTRPTPNADPARRHLNRHLAGSGDLWADISALIDPLPTRPRTTAVHAIELLLSASPEHFASGDPAVLAAWAESSLAWARGRFGDANVVEATMHLDEATPHLHVVLVPIVVKTLKGKTQAEPRLCARDITGGRHRLSRLQDEYAASVAHLGIDRGVKGARIEYEHLHRRYADMTSTPPGAALILDRVRVRKGRRLADPGRWAEEETARLLADLGPRVTAMAARCEELERTGYDNERRMAALEGHLRDATALAARGRVVGLGWVLQQLGAIRDSHDPHIWLLAGGRIAVDGRRFRDLTRHHDGVGAVDLITHLTGCDPRHALAFLAQRGGVELCMAASAEQAGLRAGAIAESARKLPAVQLVPLDAKVRPAGPATPPAERGAARRPGGSRGR